jgi:glycosyltransferase involved in cell wall biosynthesis
MQSESDASVVKMAACGRPRRAWFTDTLNDVNGVAMTIRRMAAASWKNGSPIVVATSLRTTGGSDFPHVNFQPRAQFPLPGYPSQMLSLPPFREVVRFLKEGDFSEVIISTPGPVGIAALLAAKWLGLRTAGIYHTDFPQYARILTGDAAMQAVGWSLMRRFYGRMDLVWVNSESYRRSLAQQGFSGERLRIFPRGLDTVLFHPARRSADFWQKRGVPAGATVLLYVGRISREKNLEVVAAAWERLRRAGLALAFVGDGPQCEELKRVLPDAIFTGYLAGEELAAAYASADVFLFPSTTDTFGNVVAEAQASGLPCVVSDSGGPGDLVENGVTGWVTPAHNADEFAAAACRLINDCRLREQLREGAALRAAGRSWECAAQQFVAQLGGCYN